MSLISFFLRSALLILGSVCLIPAPQEGLSSDSALGVEKAENSITSDELIFHLISFLTNDQKAQEKALNFLKSTWKEGYVPMVIDVIYLSGEDRIRKQLFKLLNDQTGQKFGQELDQWQHWLWNREPVILPFHADFMAELYRNIDPGFERYFYDRTDQSLIRLDEVRWGGVKQDGIPPLRQPRMIGAREADYLEDSHIIFGIEINGDARAYPKRILAWHEMFVDQIGGLPIAGVYCTLCGTVIAYQTSQKGTNHELGTSGFLYRSNKLMYDKATQSLWNTIEGRPVIGPLTNKRIQLESQSVVTTTWGEWRKMHPESKVLSPETGYQRDYSEGAAYQAYFATDELMFKVPLSDKRLRNKAEVLIVRAKGYQVEPLAISTSFLERNLVYHNRIAETPFVVITDKSGGNRVYESGGIKFSKLKKGNILIDERGGEWRLTEEQLTRRDGTVLRRLPYHRIFWFAWVNTYPETRLVK